jgi:hypothetical protein
MSKHFKNETGTDLILDTGILVGSAVDHYIRYQKPSGVVGSFAADVYSSYSDLASATGTYLLKHTLAYADLSEAGEWRFQAHIGAADGTWWGETAKENIYDAFEI